MNFPEAMHHGYDIFTWHTNHQTDAWTQSNDGADIDMRHIALGLVTMVADPGFINMLIAVGERTEESLAIMQFDKYTDDEAQVWFATFMDDLKRLG